MCNKGKFSGGLALIMSALGFFVLQLGDPRAMTLKQTISQPNIEKIFTSLCSVVGIEVRLKGV